MDAEARATPRAPRRRARLPWSTRLHAVFAFAMLCLVLVAAAAWRFLRDYEVDVGERLADQVRASVQLAEAEAALWQLRYGFSQFILGDGPAQERVLAEETKWYTLINGRLDAYARGHREEEERRALAGLRAEYERYCQARPRFFELWQAGQRDQAVEWRALTTTPYGAATVAAFARQIELHRLYGEQHVADSLRHAARARRFLVAVVAVLILGLSGWYWMGWRVLGPLRQLRDSMDRTVREQFGKELEVGAGNELQVLEAGLATMTTLFTANSAELSQARADLARQTDYLESTVAVRTAELERAVASMEAQNLQITLRNEMGDLMQSCDTVAEAVRVIERFALLLFPGASGAVYLADPRTESLAAQAIWGEASGREELAAADCWALRRGKLQVAGPGGSALPCPHVQLPPAGSSLCVPLAAHGEALGLFHLVCPGAGGETACAAGGQVALATALAAQIAMALANLRLRESLHQQSIRDPLTGLFNRRFLEATLHREVARGRRSGRPLAVFMLDIDHFKQFNDSYGHEAGDAVLRALGKLLKENCRQADVPCRFGGEEFTLVLPDLDEQPARDWADRLMRRVRAMEVRSGGQALPRITISMGLALLSRHGDDGETLVQAADLALYCAKHAGRDRLVVSGEETP